MNAKTPPLHLFSVFILVTILSPWTAYSQQLSVAPPGSMDIPYTHRTGTIANTQPMRRIVDVHTITIPNAPSMRVIFSNIELGPNDVIEVFAPFDGALHPINNIEAAKWQNSSAAFNGDTLLCRLCLAPGSRGGYTVQAVNVGLPMGSPESLCGADDRVASTDSRVARFQSSQTSGGGCTIWLGGPEGCAFSAGHCFTSGSLQWAEFNPPPSLSSGANQHAPPEDQYPIDPSTVVFSTGFGNDYGVCRLQTNHLNQSATANQGSFNLGFWLPAINDTIRITGHGTDDGVENQVLQTHTGPLVNIFSGGDRLNYVVDTTGGNSGSPVIHDATDTAVGVHTHAGCNPPNTGNNGTSLTNAGLVAAYNQVCNLDTISVISGDNQFSTVGNAYSTPLTVRVINSITGSPVAGVAINWTILTGSATTTTPTSTTNSQGFALCTIVAGATSGEVEVEAATSGTLAPAVFNLFTRGLRILTAPDVVVTIIDETTTGSATVPYLVMAGYPQSPYSTFIGDLCLNPLDPSNTFILCDGFGFFGFVTANGLPCVGNPSLFRVYMGTSALSGLTFSFQAVGYNPGADALGWWISNCVTITF